MRNNFLTRLVIRYTEVRQHKTLGIFGSLLQDPYLFHLNERSVPGAFSVGLFCAWIPIPFQMFVAAGLAILFRVNVPLSVVLVWITNPLTITPMFYFAYAVGAWVTGETAQYFEFQLSFDWLISKIQTIGKPLFIGCSIIGTSSAVIGYFGARLLWNERLSRLLDLKIKRQQRKRH